MKYKKPLLLFLVAIIVLSFSGCGSVIKKYDKNISELRSDIYEGGSDALAIAAITGRRENPYILDGHSSGTQEFTVITIEPKEFSVTAHYSYKAVINNAEYSGEFKLHPFGKSFSADIASKCIADSITLTVTGDAGAEEFILRSVKSADMIDEEKALQIATQRLKAQLDSLEANGNLNAEIYIRFISNPIDLSGGYYWYIAFVGEAQNVYAVLIDPISMEVVAERT